MPDSPFPPFLNNDPERLGLSEKLMKLAGRNAGLDVQFTRLPIARCRALVQDGAFDAFIAPEAAAALPNLQFPRLADGSIDAGRRLVQVRMRWVQRVDATWTWDGSAVEGFPPEGRVGFRQGYLGGVPAVRALGLRLDQTAASAEQLLRMVALGRLAAAVLIDVELDAALRTHAHVALRVLDKPLRVELYHAAVSGHSSKAHAEAWWRQFALLRDSAAFKP